MYAMSSLRILYIGIRSGGVLRLSRVQEVPRVPANRSGLLGPVHDENAAPLHHPKPKQSPAQVLTHEICIIRGTWVPFRRLICTSFSGTSMPRELLSEKQEVQVQPQIPLVQFAGAAKKVVESHRCRENSCPCGPWRLPPTRPTNSGTLISSLHSMPRPYTASEIPGTL